MLQRHVVQGIDLIVGSLEMSLSESRASGIIRTPAVGPITKPMIDGLNA
jgi:hypothetical protein